MCAGFGKGVNNFREVNGGSELLLSAGAASSFIPCRDVAGKVAGIVEDARHFDDAVVADAVEEEVAGVLHLFTAYALATEFHVIQAALAMNPAGSCLAPRRSG